MEVYLEHIVSLACSPDKERSLVSLTVGTSHVNLDASFCRPHSPTTVLDASVSPMKNRSKNS